jgi:60 kDa SS-A/Ro ribonucleoprotein
VTFFEAAKTATNPKQLAIEIAARNTLFTWEMVPTEFLNDPDILMALLPRMPMTALMRNLNRFAAAGLTSLRGSEATKIITGKLTDENLVRGGRLHPVTVLNTMKVYSQGRGVKGDLTWTPSQPIVDALQETFELSFKTLTPHGKRALYAVDVSGSMTTGVANYALSCAEIAAALMLTAIKTEENAEFIFFDTAYYEVKAGKRTTYQEILKHVGHGGGTDCGQPYEYARKSKVKFDAIVTYTDSETWCGYSHPVQSFNLYRSAIAPQCKGIVIGMVANGVSLFDEKDTTCLNVAGFDSAIPNLVKDFITK